MRQNELNFLHKFNEKDMRCLSGCSKVKK